MLVSAETDHTLLAHRIRRALYNEWRAGREEELPVACKDSVFFGCQLLGYVSRAVRPSVSYNDAKRTIPVREKQQKHSRSLAKTMKRINQTNSKTNYSPPRKSASETREPFRSQVINGAQKKGGSAQRSHWVRDTGDKRRIRSRRGKHR